MNTPPDADMVLPGHHTTDLSPEARRKRALRWRAGLEEVAAPRQALLGSRPVRVLARVASGTWQDGFIHAGNLAYMAILALFPFFVTVAAIFALIGESSQRSASVGAFMVALPPLVRKALEPVAQDVIMARSGWLLWVGGLVGLWTVGSLIETIRDILRRAYGTTSTSSYWRYRLVATAVTVLAVVALLLSLFAQVAIATAQEMIAAWAPRAVDWIDTLGTSRLVTGGVLYCSIFALFFVLTPSAYRGAGYPKWPGAALVTGWWMVVMAALPTAVARFFTYDLTYGSLAGVMIALFFFWLVGLGMVIGAELNAALAVTPEERDMIGHAVAESDLR